MPSRRNRALIRKYGGQAMAFRDLQIPAQLAIAHYMSIDGEAWPWPEGTESWSVNRLKHELRRHLPYFRENFGHVRFGIVGIPTDVLAGEIMNDEDIGWSTFEDYHQWFVSSGQMPRHQTSQRWPVILSDYEDETIQDGWHRFHDYYRQGAREIPAVYFAQK